MTAAPRTAPAPGSLGFLLRGCAAALRHPWQSLKGCRRAWRRYGPYYYLWELSFWSHALRFVGKRTGRRYGVGRLAKLKLVWRVRRNTRVIPSGSNWGQHLLLVEEILRIPPELKGVVVECGCAYGASTASLSLACALTGRKLLVCDSFEGLPEPEPGEKVDPSPKGYHDPFDAGSKPQYTVWEKGYAAVPLEVVRGHVARFGSVAACEFVAGYYRDTLPGLPADAVVMVFEDADLVSSVRDCLRSLWPKLQEGCRFWCHEPWSVPVVSVFYDARWWREELGTSAPGFCGSGPGVKIGWADSRMGYAQKIDFEKVQRTGVAPR